MTVKAKVAYSPAAMGRWTHSSHLSLVLAIALGSAIVPAHADAPVQGVLELQNGHVLDGRITLNGDHYEVAIPTGGQVVVPRSQVATIAPTWSALYRQKSAEVQVGNASQHLDLARWCLRHGLLGRAQDQWSYANAYAPGDPKVRGVLRMLEAAEQTTTANTPAALEAPRAPHRDPHVRPAAATNPEIPAISNASIEQFTRRIHPLLLNRCAATRCHGGRESSFQLWKPSAGHRATRKMASQNLSATLDQIEWQDPVRSRLLEFARQPHGANPGATAHTWTPHFDFVFRQWVAQLTRQRAATDRPIKPGTATEPPRFPHDRLDDPFSPDAFNRRFHPPATSEPTVPGEKPQADADASDSVQGKVAPPQRVQKSSVGGQ